MFPLISWGQVRVGGRHDAGDNADRLAVLDDALLWDFRNDADALLAQRIAQHAADFHALAHATLGAAQTAFLDTHRHQLGKGLFIGDRPSDGLAQAINARLVVGFDDGERLLGAHKNLVQFLLLLRRQTLAFGARISSHDGYLLQVVKR
ncbi:MAG: hypothetical protein IPK63_19805 [Candidatus Competibacteraceae bacterium]|nr:hypothetical protein [Candidatus Competibacteraceae bacterium]